MYPLHPLDDIKAPPVPDLRIWRRRPQIMRIENIMLIKNGKSENDHGAVLWFLVKNDLKYETKDRSI